MVTLRIKKSKFRQIPSAWEKNSTCFTPRYSKDTCARRVPSSIRWITSSFIRKSYSINQTMKKSIIQDSGTSKATSLVQNKWKGSDHVKVAFLKWILNHKSAKRDQDAEVNPQNSPKKQIGHTFLKREESKWKRMKRSGSNKIWSSNTGLRLSKTHGETVSTFNSCNIKRILEKTTIILSISLKMSIKEERCILPLKCLFNMPVVKYSLKEHIQTSHDQQLIQRKLLSIQIIKDI